MRPTKRKRATLAQSERSCSRRSRIPCNEFNPKQVFRFQKRARHVARKRGYPELADDFAQQIFVYFCEKPGRGATVDQLFIDYLRSTYGRPGTPGVDARRFAETRMLSLDAPIRTDEGEALNHDVIGDSRRNSGAYYELRDCSFLFTGREATIYARYFIDQAHEQTIADELCVSPARISQVLASMKSKIKEYYISREVRERIEWDEEFGIYFVDWIQI